MTPRSPLRRVLRVLGVALLAAACTDSGAPTAPDGIDLQSAVTITYEAGDGGQFAFLEPMSKGMPSGPLATGLTPVVVICNVTTLPATGCMQLDATEELDHYHANWRDKTALPNETYSIDVVTSFGFLLGSLEIFLDGESGDKAGRTFPIKFWIGEDLGTVVASSEECFGDPRCNTEPVPPVPSGGPPIVVQTEDENGEIMAELTFPPESVPPGGLLVRLDCRKEGFAPTEGPLPTLLNQWPMFCEILAFNPDGSLFTGTLAVPANLDVCVVDELFNGSQPPYHGFVNFDALTLGKSPSGTGDTGFEFLPEGFTNLDCTGNSYVAQAPTNGLFGVGSRLASTLGDFFRPQPLWAAPMYFRDGGVGGQVGSFSDINPVELPTVEGTVIESRAGSASEFPLSGVTVTLSGPGLTTSLVTTTDGSGAYSFPYAPLLAETPSGTTYTVTISDLPDGSTIDDPSQDVLINGSGTFVVDFVTGLPDGIYYYDATGNYYTSDANPVPWATADLNANALDPFRFCYPRLVAIESAGEDAFITTNMPQAAQAGIAGSSGNGGYWLGGRQIGEFAEPGGGWTWVTGQDFPGNNLGPVYANWAGGEPNNSGGAENHLQYLGDWTGTASEKIRWNDEPGVRSYGYVVEYDCVEPEAQ